MRFALALALDDAHRRGLAVALENDGDQARELAAYFDLARATSDGEFRVSCV